MKPTQILLAFFALALPGCQTKQYYDRKFEISFDKLDSLQVGSTFIYHAYASGKVLAITNDGKKYLVQVETRNWVKLPGNVRFVIKPNSSGKPSIIAIEK